MIATPSLTRAAASDAGVCVAYPKSYVSMRSNEGESVGSVLADDGRFLFTSRQTPIYKPADSPLRSGDIRPQGHSSFGPKQASLANGSIELLRYPAGNGRILSKGRANGTNRGDDYGFVIRSQRPSPVGHDTYFTDVNVHVDSRAKAMKFHFPNVKSYADPVHYDEMLIPLTMTSDGGFRLDRPLSTQQVTQRRARGECYDVFSSDIATTFAVLPGGNVGIGTEAPTVALDVRGDLRLAALDRAPVGCAAAQEGSVAVTDAGSLCVCSENRWRVANGGGQACQW